VAPTVDEKQASKKKRKRDEPTADSAEGAIPDGEKTKKKKHKEKRRDGEES